MYEAKRITVAVGKSIIEVSKILNSLVCNFKNMQMLKVYDMMLDDFQTFGNIRDMDNKMIRDFFATPRDINSFFDYILLCIMFSYAKAKKLEYNTLSKFFGFYEEGGKMLSKKVFPIMDLGMTLKKMASKNIYLGEVSNKYKNKPESVSKHII